MPAPSRRVALRCAVSRLGTGTAQCVMDLRHRLEMLPQPDETTCGPTCLQALYSYYDDAVALQDLVQQVPVLAGGGTLAVHLACHALRRGYRATIYTYNLQVFDPTWFAPGKDVMAEKLLAQRKAKPNSPKLQDASLAYLDFLALGGKLRYEDLTSLLLRRLLDDKGPILTGLSSTYLYACAREKGSNMAYDDVAGEPCGHFVVLCGYDRAARTVLVADPLLPNPMAPVNQYAVNIDRLVCAILLGILTYDANLLLITRK